MPPYLPDVMVVLDMIHIALATPTPTVLVFNSLDEVWEWIAHDAPPVAIYSARDEDKGGLVSAIYGLLELQHEMYPKKRRIHGS